MNTRYLFHFLISVILGFFISGTLRLYTGPSSMEPDRAKTLPEAVNPHKKATIPTDRGEFSALSMKEMIGFAQSGHRQCDVMLTDLVTANRIDEAVRIALAWLQSSADLNRAGDWLLNQDLDFQKLVFDQGLRRLMDQGRFLEVIPLLEQIDKSVELHPEVAAKAASEIGAFKGFDEGLRWLNDDYFGDDEARSQFVTLAIQREPLWVLQNRSSVKFA